MATADIGSVPRRPTMTLSNRPTTLESVFWITIGTTIMNTRE